MIIEVELGDLRQVVNAIDDAITTMDPDVAGLVNAIEILQTYIDNASEENGSQESSSEEESDEADTTEVQADDTEDDFEDDIPF